MKIRSVWRLFDAGAEQSFCFFKPALLLAYQPKQLQRIRLLRYFVDDLLTGIGRRLQPSALL